MFCPKCGTQNEDANAVCIQCQYAFPQTQAPVMESSANQIPLQQGSVGVPPQATAVPTQPVVNFQAFSDILQQYQAHKDPKMMRYMKLGIFFTVALLVLVFCLISAGKLSTSGANLTELRSVDGGTVAEAYYQLVGQALLGLSHFVRAVGLLGAAVLAGIGLKK